MIRSIRMPSPLPFRAALAALWLAAASLSACQSAAPPSDRAAAAADPKAVALIRQDIVPGIYEVAYRAADNAVYVASTPSFDAGTPGYVYRLDGDDLSQRQVVQLPQRAFALGLNPRSDTLYVGHTLDGSISAVDARGGGFTRAIQVGQPDAKGNVEHTRKVVVDEAHDRLFVSSPGRPGKIWIVDAAAGTVAHTVESPGIWSAGLAYAAAANRLYVGQGGAKEILVIDPDSGQIAGTFATGDGKDDTPEGSKHFFINLALDEPGGRLFAIDSNTNQIYVFETGSGRILQRLPVGLGALDIAYNGQRKEIYATNRGVTQEERKGTGALTVFDAESYAVKRTIALPPHPNSIAVHPNGQVLYVTVKMPHDKEHPLYRTGAVDGVVRIDLRAAPAGS